MAKNTIEKNRDHQRGLSITAKLLAAFISIVALSLIALLFTITSLQHMGEIQHRITQKTLPLLSVSQNLSLSVSEYLSLLEKLATLETRSPSLKAEITEKEVALQDQVIGLAQITHLTTEMSLISEIFKQSENLQVLVFVDEAKALQRVNNSRQHINKTIKNIRGTTLQFQVTTSEIHRATFSIIGTIERQLLNIEEALGQYNQSYSWAQLKQLQLHYISAVRKITQHLVRLDHKDLKQQLAHSAGSLFDETFSDNGLFSSTEALRSHQDLIQKTILEYRTKETELNTSLGTLLNDASTKAENDLAEFSATMEHNILLISIILMISICLTGFTLYFYILPRITRRLQQLSKNTQQVASKNYNIVIDTSGSDEIGEMARALDGFRHSLIVKEELHLSVRENQTRLQNIIENTLDGLITFSPQGIVRSFNQGCERIFQWTENDIVGQNITTLLPLAGIRRTQYAQHSFFIDNTEVINTRSEAQGIQRNGKAFPVDLSATKITVNGETLFSGIIRDISLQKQNELEREQLIEQLTNSNEELERFAFVCSHDLQEPLRMIRSFSEKLQSHMRNQFEDDEKGQRYFHFITEGATRAQNLISDILEYSSIDNGTKPNEVVSISSIISLIQDNMSTSLQESGGHITFDRMPDVKGNKTQLYQLFQNLINNGLKYQLPETKPSIHITAEDKGDAWQFSIQDNGIGMEERHFKQIFEVFKRLHRSNQYNGTGIGLSICKKVVERHGGRIWVESQKGKGSTFYFTIPKAFEI